MGAFVTATVAGEEKSLKFANAAFSAVHQLLADAASRRATRRWHAHVAVWLARHDLNLYGHNVASYDIAELPWHVAPEPELRAFLLDAVDDALADGIERLEVTRDYITPVLVELRELYVSGAASNGPPPPPFDDDDPEEYRVCPLHDVFLYLETYCTLCEAHVEAPRPRALAP